MIKDNDYMVTLAPMKRKLKLKGHALDLFAIIYGYSKDGESTCRASLTYLAEWLDTDKHAVSKILKRLVDAGYINRIEYRRGDMKCYEYTSNYGAMLAKAERGEPMGLPTAKRVVKNTTVVKMTQKGCKNDNETVVKMTTNNLDNNIYTSFSSYSPEQQEKEKRDFYNSFFFRNAADPAAEVERFIAYNDCHGWSQQDGKTFETPEKRLNLAKLWSFRQEGQWARADYLKAVEGIYKAAVREGIEGVEVIINHKIVMTWDGRETRWLWSVTPEAKAWIEANSAMVRKHLDSMVSGRRVSWNIIKS